MLTKEDYIENENNVSKDLSRLLTSNRKKESIIVADLFSNDIIHQGLSHTVKFGKEYCGDQEYSHI